MNFLDVLSGLSGDPLNPRVAAKRELNVGQAQQQLADKQRAQQQAILQTYLSNAAAAKMDPEFGAKMPQLAGLAMAAAPALAQASQAEQLRGGYPMQAGIGEAGAQNAIAQQQASAAQSNYNSAVTAGLEPSSASNAQNEANLASSTGSQVTSAINRGRFPTAYEEGSATSGQNIAQAKSGTMAANLASSVNRALSGTGSAERAAVAVAKAQQKQAELSGDTAEESLNQGVPRAQATQQLRQTSAATLPSNTVDPIAEANAQNILNMANSSAASAATGLKQQQAYQQVLDSMKGQYPAIFGPPLAAHALGITSLPAQQAMMYAMMGQGFNGQGLMRGFNVDPNGLVSFPSTSAIPIATPGPSGQNTVQPPSGIVNPGNLPRPSAFKFISQ